MLAVSTVVGLTAVLHHVTQWSKGGEFESADFGIDLAYGREAVGQIDVRINVLRREAFGEGAGLFRAVVFLNVLPAARDGKQVQQPEIVETKHLQQPGR